MKSTFIFVEGMNDERFINNIIRPLFYKKDIYNVFTIKYQSKPNNLVNKHISTAIKNNTYIFLSDLDSHSFSCISSRKDKRLKEYKSLKKEHIIIVKEEIESWFIAGVNTELDKFKNLEIPENTETLTKEDAEKIIEKNFDSKITFINELSKNYDYKLAIKRNKSFKYFLKKINLFDIINS